MRFIHCADIHLGSQLKGLEAYEGAPADRIRSAPERAFTNLIDYALDEHVDFVLIAGDLYDGNWKDYRVGLYFARQMGRLKQAGIPAYLIYGNHDAESRLTKSVPLPDNVHAFSASRPETFISEQPRVAIHGQSFRKPAVTDNLAAKYPKPLDGYFNIGLLHTAADDRQHEPYAPCDPRQLAAHGYDYWALGHVHQRRVIGEGNSIAFPGNLQGRHIRESGPKGFSLVTADVVSGGIEVRFVPADVARWQVLDLVVEEHETVDEVARAFQRRLISELDVADGRLLCCRVNVRGRSRLDAVFRSRPNEMEAVLRASTFDVASDDVWIEKIEVNTTPYQDIEVLRQRPDALGTLLRDLCEVGGGNGELDQIWASLRRIVELLPDEVIEESDILRAIHSGTEQEVIGQARRLLEARLMEMEAPE